LTVKNGEARLEVSAPTQLDLGADTLIGYQCDAPAPIDVPEGNEPLTSTIPVKPAGTIFGIITKPDGAPARVPFSVQLVYSEPLAPEMVLPMPPAIAPAPFAPMNQNFVPATPSFDSSPTDRPE